jgi:hypothetical protein
VIGERALFEKSFRRYEPEGDSFERLARRRDRKRRNQRIAAGVAGIAVFVAAVWIVTSDGWFDRTETPAVTGPTVPPDAGWDGIGLPPEGTELSSPVTGKLIGRGVRRCGFRCAGVTYFGAVFVYADGRVILYPAGGGYHPITEQRLTPEGVALVRSGAVEPTAFLYPRRPEGKLPASMWADHKSRPYAPSRYAVCFYGSEGAVDLSRLGRVLPASAETLLRGNERDYRFQPVECFELTTVETRALDEILSDAYVERPGFSPPALERVMRDDAGNRIWIEFRTLLPHGSAYGVGG